MLDEREGPVDSHEAHRAFNRQSVWRRFAIVLAGPVANFLLAIVLYWILFMHGVPGLKPVLGAVPQPGSNAGTKRLTPIAGQVPLLRAEPAHCVFSPRCGHAEPRCLTGQPALRQVTGGDTTGEAHQAACVLDRIPDPARETAPRAPTT